MTLSLSLLTGVVVGGLGSLAGAAWGAALLVLLPSWTNDLAHSLSLNTNAQGNLPFAIYGVVLIVADARLAHRDPGRGGGTETVHVNEEEKRMKRTFALAALAAAAALVAGCGSSSSGGGSGSAPGVTATSITFGTHQPLTGPAAPGYSEIAPASRRISSTSTRTVACSDARST